jgi:hypothetical protein
MASGDRPSSGSAADSGHPAARFAADCALQLDICQSLLAIADKLPGSVSTTTIDVISNLLQTTWTSHLTLQKNMLLPLIQRRHQEVGTETGRFAPLTKQHIEISGINDELIECFRMFARGEAIDAETLGYLIRNAAERRREHVEWEKSLLAPLLPEILTPVERRIFSEWAAANPWPFDDFKAITMRGLI